ncbi:hypothetical protein GCM10007862_15940 [Dyella lipolytica]|uniref:Uncharacterized protein n=2 Tax=Dyella lipolytica TaxID=1867835 RepID=A0ABW8ITB4_9GAMM|nr:hypothetical protein GCM10007862_15940 [Dyella lipolytica]
MFQGIKRLWSGSDPVEFESAFGMAESVERLRAATRRWGVFSVSQEAASGTVKESRVSLQRVIPMVGNSFKPFYVGHFEQRGHKVVLTGRFTLNWFVKLFMGFWFGFCTLFVATGLIAAIHSPKSAPVSLAGIGMLLAGAAMVRLGGWLSRNDQAWLSNVIRIALNVPVAGPQIGAFADVHGTPQSNKTPRVILIVTAVLALSGVMGCISAFTGIQSYQSNMAHSVIRHYADMRLRYVAAIYGVSMLALAYGVYRRRLLAWRFGFVALVGGFIMQTIALLMGPDLGNARIPAIFFCAISAVIMAVWGRWWYAQRVHFHE